MKQLSRCILNLMTSVLIRKRPREFWNIHTEKTQMDTETGVMRSQAKECQQPPESWTQQITDFPLDCLHTPWFQIFSLQNCKRVHFYGFNPSACGYLVQHSQENDAPITNLSHLKVLIQLNKNLSFERSSFTIESMKNNLYSI